MRDDAPAVSPSDAFDYVVSLPPISLSIVLSALPGILLVWTNIWLVFGAMTWTIGQFLAPSLIGYAIAGCVLFAPAAWASWEIMVRALASERELAASGH